MSAEQIDYNYVPEVDGGKFLNLRAKGDKIDIRIASKPISYFVHWIDKKPKVCPDRKTCETCNKVYKSSQAEEAMAEKLKQVFCWFVINRADGKAYIYKGGVGIFRSIAEYGKNPKWGDPMLYDLEITRTEIKPQYYSVVPDPSTKGQELTAEELASTKELEPLMDFTTTTDPKPVVEEQEEVPKEEDLPF